MEESELSECGLVVVKDLQLVADKTLNLFVDNKKDTSFYGSSRRYNIFLVNTFFQTTRGTFSRLESQIKYRI